jgi:hypothetical protein
MDKQKKKTHFVEEAYTIWDKKGVGYGKANFHRYSWENIFPDNKEDELLGLNNKTISIFELATMLKLIDGCN